MMKLVMYGMSVLVVVALVATGFAAEKRGTAAEAEAMVKKAIELAKSKGNEAVFSEVNNPKGQFHDRDLYVFVYDINGKCVAHGQNPMMIGRDLINMKDADGKLFVKERVEIAKTKGKGWQDYKFTYPLTKGIDDKRAYIERYGDLIYGSGIYK